MAVWLCRAGRIGEHEARFFEENKIFYTFEEVSVSLSSFGSVRDLQEYFLQIIPSLKRNSASNFAGQGNAFCNKMQIGDWVITPSKTAPGLLHIAEISGNYTFDENAEEAYRHSRAVKWFAKIRREQFDQDIQSSLGALMTICNVPQENRVRKTVSAFLSSANCTNILPPPPLIWNFCRLTQYPTISSAIIRGMASPALLRLS